MSSLKNRRRRLSLVVERDLQLQFTLKFCLVNSVLFVAFAVLNIYFFRTHYEFLIENALLQAPELVEQLRRDLRVSTVGAILLALLASTLSFLIGMVLTKKIAGPIKALKKHLRELAAGKEPRMMRLRNGDELHDLQMLFNEAVKSLSDQSQKELLLLNKIDAILSEVKLDEFKRTDLSESSSELRNCIQKRKSQDIGDLHF